MTARPLPEWVVERLARAIYGEHIMTVEFVAAAFLAIIEERAPGWQIHYKSDGRDEYVTLAELLEREDGS